MREREERREESGRERVREGGGERREREMCLLATQHTMCKIQNTG